MKLLASLSWAPVVTALGLMSVQEAIANPPGLINHQGRIAVNGVNFDGTGHFKFALVEGDPVTSTLWTTDGTGVGMPGSVPTGSLSVTVSNGHYAVALGATNAIGAGLFSNRDDVRVRIWFSTSGSSGTFELLTPDRRIGSAGFALNATLAEGIDGDLAMNDNRILDVERVGIGTTDPQAVLHIERVDLGPVPANSGGGVVLEGVPAKVALISRTNDNLGSELELTEVDSAGEFVDRWRVVRTSSANPTFGSSSLWFGYGSTVSSTQLVVSISKEGHVSAKDITARGDLLVEGDLIHLENGTDPTILVQSDGNDEISGRLSLRQDNSSGVDIYYDGTSSEDGLRIDPYLGTTAAATALYVSNRNDGTRGNVGVGTTTPAFKFVANGKARFNGVIGAGSGTPGVVDLPYNFFDNETPTPDSGDITTSDDVYIGRDLEVEQTVYAAAFTVESDRNAKRGFAPVHPLEVLEKVTAIPITTWQFKEEQDDDGVRHMGAMAQDFHAAFGVGRDERHISTVDADGVALAAIQGLNQKLEVENAKLQATVSGLEARLAKLEAALLRGVEKRSGEAR